MEQKDPKHQGQEGQQKENKIRNNQIIVFKLGGEEYALFIDQIKEVVVTPHISKVPLTPSYIRGLANIRGQILSIVDLEDKFGLNASVKDSESYCLVVESADYNMAILVQEVPNTLSVADDEIEYTNSVFTEQVEGKSYVKGIVKLGGRLIILIDAAHLLTKDEIAVS
ncbi:chemotaxis protein CheW [Algivirga pacifica]|uniref:Chemotaxis protein CheW n=1 Tax=Algivirga pacifica TaxID=1162670 RepID=A0ABP9DJI5_9BACT